MPDYIVLRLTPAAAIDAATFKGYLTGLTVTAFDISHDNSSGEVALAVTTASETGSTVTLGGSFGTSVSVGDRIRVAGVGTGYDGVFVCTGVTSTSLTYQAGSSGLPTLSSITGGTVQPHVIGIARYNHPTLVPLPSPHYTYPAGTSIAQHFDPSNPSNLESVATAVIPVPVGIPEYISPSIQIEFDRTGFQANLD